MSEPRPDLAAMDAEAERAARVCADLLALAIVGRVAEQPERVKLDRHREEISNLIFQELAPREKLRAGAERAALEGVHLLVAHAELRAEFAELQLELATWREASSS